MYKVKSKHRNKALLVIIADKDRVKKGKSNKVYLDIATQEELKYIYNSGLPFVDKIKPKKDEAK